MSCKIGQLVMSPESKSGPLGRIFISQPNPTEESYLGRLFVVAEIQSRKPDNQELVDFIIATVNQTYYSEEQLTILGKTSVLTTENIFEAAIADLNRQLMDFFDRKKMGFAANSANITIGVLQDNRLYFSNLGNNKALLIYQPKTTDAKSYEGYNLINVSKKVSDPTQEIFSQDKLFGSLIKGAVPPGASFLFVNEALHEYLTEHQLIKIVTTLSPASAAKQIRNTLEQTSVFVSFLALIIKNGGALEIERVRSGDDRVKVHEALSGQPAVHKLNSSRQQEIKRPTTDTNKDSIRALNQTESRTAEILKPSGLVNVSEVFKYFTSLNPLSWWPSRKKTNLIIKREQVVKHRTSAALSSGIGYISKAVLIVIHLIKQGWELLSQPERRQSAWQRLKNLPAVLQPKHWISLTVFLLALGTLIGGLIFSQHNRKQQAIRQANETAIASINQRFDELSAAMIYDNQQLAKSYIDEIDGLINQISEQSEAGRQSKEEQRKRYQNASDQLYKVNRLSNLQPVEGWQADNPTSLISYGGKLYANDNGKLLVFDPAAKRSETLTDSLTDCRLLPVSEAGDWLYCLKGSTTIAINQRNKSSKNMTIAEAGEVVSAAIYNNRLYLANRSQVLRFSQSGDNWSGKQNWLPDADTANLRDLAIDGSVYLLYPQGVAKFYAGRRQNDFNLAAVRPSLDQAERLSTSKGAKYLAILDKSQGRVIVYNKDGQLQTQYFSDNWQDLRAISLSDDNQLFILNGKDLYRLGL